LKPGLIEVTVLGAGPAGSAAAIAASQAGAGVRIYEKSTFPRHKVCGEFLSPEVANILERLGASAAFAAASPRPLDRFALHFGKYTKYGHLPERGFGLSRYRFDRLLLDGALDLGAQLVREPAPTRMNPPVVVATGRRFQGKRGGRLFGFKAHFKGPPCDSIDLFFFGGCYVGVNSIEDGLTNVCGIGPEEVLKQSGFEPDTLTANFRPLRDRLGPLTRSMEWLLTGPLYFRDRLTGTAADGHYHAGDQLSFVDPFTGTGILAALLSGSAAGRAAAIGRSPSAYLRESSPKIKPALRVSALFRHCIEIGVARWLAPLVPSRLLVQWTRPKIRYE
jgi:hypothetical protein